jgi:methylated-DNA-[protein]-cysteine S-methyltransferase
MDPGPDSGAALFPTALGRCGVAWRGDVLTSVQLPEADERRTARRLSQSSGTTSNGAPGGASGAVAPVLSIDRAPAEVRRAVAAMTALLEGEPVDLTWVTVDLAAAAEFEQAVLAVTRTIPFGSSLTYGQVAVAVGQPGAAQAVGRALGSNRWPIVVPCHRVLGANGALTGFSAAGGVATKRRMLLIEGCPAVPPSLFD